jgi:hypothetical protein
VKLLTGAMVWKYQASPHDAYFFTPDRRTDVRPVTAKFGPAPERGALLRRHSLDLTGSARDGLARGGRLSNTNMSHAFPIAG